MSIELFLEKIRLLSRMCNKELRDDIIQLYVDYVYLPNKRYPHDLECMFRAAFSTWKYSHFPKPAELIALIPNTEGQQSMMSVAEVRAKSKAHWGLMGGYPDVKTEGVQP